MGLTEDYKANRVKTLERVCHIPIDANFHHLSQTAAWFLSQIFQVAKLSGDVWLAVRDLITVHVFKVGSADLYWVLWGIKRQGIIYVHSSTEETTLAAGHGFKHVVNRGSLRQKHPVRSNGSMMFRNQTLHHSVWYFSPHSYSNIYYCQDGQQADPVWQEKKYTKEERCQTFFTQAFKHQQLLCLLCVCVCINQCWVWACAVWLREEA